LDPGLLLGHFEQAACEAAARPNIEHECVPLSFLGNRADGKRVRGERLQSASGQEPEIDMLAGAPLHARLDTDLECMLGLPEQDGPMAQAVLEIRPAGTIPPAERIEDARGDKIIPTRHAEIAMNKEEYHEYPGGEVMACLEEFVVAVADPGDREEGKPGLCEERDHACYPDATCFEFAHDVAFPDVEDDEWEGVYERERVHRPGDPVVPDV